MPSFYGTQTANTTGPGPPQGSYAPIPNLGTLTITDNLYFGGLADVSLFLGSSYSDDIISFSFYARVVETTTSTVVAEVNFGGTNGLNSLIALSAVYDLPAQPKTPPVLAAEWQVMGTPGVVIMAPSVMVFSATVYENQGP